MGGGTDGGSVVLWLWRDGEVCVWYHTLPWFSTGGIPWGVTDFCLQERFRLDIRKNSSLKEQSGTGTRSPGMQWSHHSWKWSKNEEMWHFVMWLSGQSGIQSKVGLDGLVFSNLNDSMIPCCGSCCHPMPQFPHERERINDANCSWKISEHAQSMW